jgi:hypothetical protein
LAELQRVATGFANFLQTSYAISFGLRFVRLVGPSETERKYIWAELGAAWYKGIPIVPILYKITKAELQADPNVPIFIKKRDLIDINELDEYFQQLKVKLQTSSSPL